MKSFYVKRDSTVGVKEKPVELNSVLRLCLSSKLTYVACDATNGREKSCDSLWKKCLNKRILNN